ncbi:MAG: flavodoxin domain-containing protein [Lautropia sp.]|nr:flavodoxin domain-containing protein [Lautropia sp.]
MSTSIQDANPLPAELVNQLGALTPTQLAWLSGYCWSRCNPADATLPLQAPRAAQPMEGMTGTASSPTLRRITILSASQTGNARRVAEQLHDALSHHELAVRLIAAADYKSKSLTDEDILLLVSSTQGEGEPPEEAVPLHKYLFGKKAPKLDSLHFAVLGLGDSSYPQFCQAGRDLDARLAELGARRLHDRGDCDLDFQATAQAWIDGVTATLTALCRAPATTPAAQLRAGTHPLPGTASPDSDSGTSGATPDTASALASPPISRDTPFAATLSVRQKITARDAEKDIEHIEIDLGDSGLHYQPGDALGVWPVNAPALVGEILSLHQRSGDERITLRDGRSLSLRDALTHELDITQITPAFVRQYADATGLDALNDRLAQPQALEAWLACTPPIGVFAEYPHPLPAQTLVELFRPQSPRLYSIASAQDEVGDEVHLTVGVVQYRHHQQHYTGAASGYLGQLLEEGDTVRVFVEPNPLFRLPEDGNTPIIMIGAGTGVAPFRAFMQQREANGDTGANWLVFGNQRFTDDFLYQAEWLQYRKSGLLTRADLAWSRQGGEKIYVQHKLRAAGADLWQWLQDGAHIYVCGDARRMAHDVEQALLDIIAAHGNMDADDADDCLNTLREERRYQRDVY